MQATKVCSWGRVNKVLMVYLKEQIMSKTFLATLGVSQQSKQASRNPWVLGWVLFVLVVLAVNVGLIVVAQTSNPGLVDKNYYDHGRDFEQNSRTKIAARARLAWETRLEIPERIAMAQPAPLRFTVVDNQGLPVTDADVIVTAYRPADAAADFKVTLQHHASGRYQAETIFPLKGAWDLMVHAKRGVDEYDLTRRIAVQP